ncbi:23S rRNA pseudouridine(2605) synthase RluB [Thiohalophilus thiocyanatoxydans]|uniref:Pseudouridine synthase n=1 Tax=Thiohalophilus thiocyanatoxydans TaxID=381308 RepID=A0A4R8IYV7_9GAMM|nr:23S rRNA pseudouridine(2605) synthase RluB [Thiohalophilus thiocyanatoxydans]TDY02633.1 23S rRNA pseudouridine2605 synthase [Thiohalophilus thiocyanatoxydans]
MAERVQKVLAQAGYGSRREIESWIEQGRIEINGQPAKLGDRVEAEDEIRLNGKPVRRTLDLAPRRILLYNKPEGEICSRNDPEGRPTVFDKLPPVKNGRWIVVGRLDINSSGLILFTTDGELANRLMHPSYEIEREYAVRVLGEFSDETRRRLRTGVQLDDGPARFDDIVDGGGQGVNHWYYVLLHEGRNREVRRLFEQVGVTVNRLIRTRFGNLFLPRRVPQGKWQELGEKDLNNVLKLVGMDEALPKPSRPAKKQTRKKTASKKQTRKKTWRRTSQ